MVVIATTFTHGLESCFIGYLDGLDHSVVLADAVLVAVVAVVAAVVVVVVVAVAVAAGVGDGDAFLTTPGAFLTTPSYVTRHVYKCHHW